MRLARRITLVLVAFALSGCAMVESLTLPNETLDSRLDRWIADRQYGRALNLLSRIDPKDPEYPVLAEKRRRVEALAQTFEQEVVDQAQKSVEAGNWGQALDNYDHALERLPDSAVLKDGLAELHRRQEARVAAQRLDLMIARAQYLKRSLPRQEAIARISPRDNEAQRRLQEQREELERTALELARTGAVAFNAGEYEVAERTLPLAAELSSAEAVQRPNAELQAWHEQRERDLRRARERRLREAREREQAAKRRFDELLGEYRSAFEAGHYDNARTLLAKLESAAPEEPIVGQERQQFEQTLRSEVERLYEEGVTYYSRGQFERAIEVWQRTLELAPEHRSAAESLERAERVMQRFQQLREKQSRLAGTTADS